MPLTRAAGRKLYYELHGRREGVPLILVATLGGSCSGWLPLQVPEFSRHRTTLIFDHRGVGESEDTGEPFRIPDLAEDLLGLLDSLEIERADVLGSFMGGMVAQEFALHHPERVRRLVLVGTFARADAKRRILLEKWREMARTGVSDEVFVKERLLWTLQDETLEQGDLIDAMVEFFRSGGAPLTADLWTRQLDACIRHDTMDRLHQIEAATLVICGRQDQLTPPRFHRELADEIPNSRLLTLSYGAHLVMAESAERFNQAVLQYLDVPGD